MTRKDREIQELSELVSILCGALTVIVVTLTAAVSFLFGLIVVAPI